MRFNPIIAYIKKIIKGKIIWSVNVIGGCTFQIGEKILIILNLCANKIIWRSLIGLKPRARLFERFLRLKY